MPIAITRAVSPRMAECELTHYERQPIDVALAEKQHEEYEDALRMLGCEVDHAPELPFHPDSVFVEDCAVVLDELAIITRPGVESRVGEVHTMAETLESYRKRLHYIESPGVLDGGDVLRIGRQLWVGLSGRSNVAAVAQLQELLIPMGYSVVGVKVNGCLHLKSAVTQIGPDTLLLNPGWIDSNIFKQYNLIETHPDEPCAANALLVGETVIYPVDYPLTALRLAEAGIDLWLIDNSEVIKAEGGVTCCSVVFE
jgi:dimethylargininase